MIINGKTTIVVNGKPTRVCGSRFNQELRASDRDASAPFNVTDASGANLVPSSGLSWRRVAEFIRAGKSVQARAGKPAAKFASL